jgi:hypothetical protein
MGRHTALAAAPATLFVLLAVAPAVADTADDAAPRPRVRLTPFGFVRVEGAMVQADPNVAFVGRADGFELQYARLGVDADIASRVRARLSLDGALDVRDRVNDATGTLQLGIRDVYADVQAGPIDVRVGHFEPVFDGEEFVSAPGRPFVDTALYSRGIRPTEGFQTEGLSPGRSLGVAARREPATGSFGVGFEVAAQNGAAELSSNNDNDWLALSAAGMLRLPREGWAIAALRWNARSEGTLPTRQDETDLQASFGAMIPAGPVWLGGGAIFERTTFPTTGGQAENSWGAHGQVLGGIWRSPSTTLSLGYRFAIFDASTLVLTDRTMEHTAGAIAAWPRQHLRVLVNVTHAMEQAARELANSRVEALVEVTL